MPVVQDPWGQGGVEGSFLSSATLFSRFQFFATALPSMFETTCFLEYHFFAHSPRGTVGGWVLVLVSHVFSPGFAPAAVSQVACLRCLPTQVFLFLFLSSLSFLPPFLASPPSYTSF